MRLRQSKQMGRLRAFQLLKLPAATTATAAASARSHNASQCPTNQSFRAMPSDLRRSVCRRILFRMSTGLTQSRVKNLRQRPSRPHRITSTQRLTTERCKWPSMSSKARKCPRLRANTWDTTQRCCGCGRTYAACIDTQRINSGLTAGWEAMVTNVASPWRTTLSVVG